MNWKAILREVCLAFNSLPGMTPNSGVLSRSWWFCFGTMLTLVRDHGKFKKMDDVDVGVLYDTFEWRHIHNWYSSRGYLVENKIIDDVTKKPMYMSLKPCGDNAMVTGEWFLDIFAWRKWNGFYWHTYDTQMERPTSGVPSRYVFKGVPCELFDAGCTVRENLADSMMHGWVPLRYGTLLDLWYPDWLHKREECSHDKYVLECKSCSAFETGKFLRQDV